MKEIKAYIHPHRTAAVIQALKDSAVCDTQAGAACFHIAVSPVQCIHPEGDAVQQHYSVELGEPVILQNRLELVCSDEAADALVELIVRLGHAGHDGSGWVQAHSLERRVPIA